MVFGGPRIAKLALESYFLRFQAMCRDILSKPVQRTFIQELASALWASVRCCSLKDPIFGYGDPSSLEVDSRLLTINRQLQDFFLRSRQSLDFFLSSRQYGQLLKPRRVESMVNFLEKSKLLQDLGPAT